MTSCISCGADLPNVCAYCKRPRKQWMMPDRRSVYCSQSHSQMARNKRQDRKRVK